MSYLVRFLVLDSVSGSGIIILKIFQNKETQPFLDSNCDALLVRSIDLLAYEEIENIDLTNTWGWLERLKCQ